MPTQDIVDNRCRLVLVTPADHAPDDLARRLAAAGRGGDVASVIVPQYGLDEDAYQALLEAVVPAGQAIGAAVIAAGEPRIAARSGADGIHVRGDAAAVARAMDEYGERWVVGSEAGKSRHGALEVGEARPDYVFFGRLGADTHPEPHAGALENAAWWAEFVEVPAVLMGGHDLAHLDRAAASGADFVALSQAVLGADADAEAAVRTANEILARHVFAEVV
ncbi:MAG: thiamine phosphate synthase [Phyllobacteriaceae bacterium]|nr:thiamine phosphate synthase [Phyllobacteriaceae bacterium]